MKPSPESPPNEPNAAKGKAVLVVLSAVIVVAVSWFVVQALWRGQPSNIPDVAWGGGSSDEAVTVRGLKHRQRSQAEEIEARIDARNSAWKSEAFTDVALTQLKKLGKLLAHAEDLTPDQLAPIASVQVHCARLRPLDLVDVYTGGTLRVRRPSAPLPNDETPLHGFEGLGKALSMMTDGMDGAKEIKTHFKITRASMSGTNATTISLLHVHAQLPDQVHEIHATWRCTWEVGAPGGPRLARVELTEYEDVVLRQSGLPLFADCTLSALGDNESFQRHLRYGMTHWNARIESGHQSSFPPRSGIAVGDVNGDGLDDIYVCQTGGLPNRLYVQMPDGKLVDKSKSSGTAWLDECSSALIVDLDNNGDQDLLVVAPAQILVMQNDGEGAFVLRGALSTLDSDLTSLSAVDYDADGDLDIYACIALADPFVRPDEPTIPFVYHDANDGGANCLFRNDIEGQRWRFTDVTKEAGLDTNNRRHSLAASWEDFDDDGDPDLYVGNDYGRNSLYRNDDGKFVDVAPQAGVVDQGGGMSVSWGDYDRDGYVDLYVGNMFSTAGSRITRQQQFQSGRDQEVRLIYRRFAKGNSLFRNLGGGKFAEVSGPLRVEMGRWAWSSVFADINNDGWEDLVVANGFLTTEDTGDL